jgi:hypothetical protein
MNSGQIEENVKAVVENLSKEEFVFELLLAYGLPKATITLLKKGKHNLSKKEGQVILKKKLFFQEVQDKDLHETIDSLQKDTQTMRHEPRFIIVTDYETLLAVDTKTREHLDTSIRDISKRYDFFLPWAGIEKHKHKNENPADRKAAEKMAKLYDGILAENEIVGDSNKTHDLNVFLSRLLFCFFAEDTNIFSQGLFTDSVASHTRADGSDLDLYLEKLFAVLNTKEEDRSNLPEHFCKFPYVNGGLFKDHHWVPKFSAKSHRIIIECGELDWKQINPDIFGSMMQAVTHPGERSSLGMHYTSVPNIMKVIEPLFLNDFRAAFEKCRGNKKKLDELRIRMSKIKFFDPACGSGNFLIITYKELRRLEMEIIKEIGAFSFSDLQLSQFYGIEIDDFAHEIARLSLYLAEHQMNEEFKHEFGNVRPTLPLRESGNIVCGNATRMNWEEICPKNEGDEIYIFGNPPYLGFNLQDVNQRADMGRVFSSHSDYRRLDYICCWFFKGSQYIYDATARLAFVSTNSICQGEQVNLLWPYIFKEELEIGFAVLPFKWSNNAKSNAGVTVVIIGLRKKSEQAHYLYNSDQQKEVNSINAYLSSGSDIIVAKRGSPLSDIPEMLRGDMPIDGGNLILSKVEKDYLMNNYSDAKFFVREFVGADELLRGVIRWCLWISNESLEIALKIPLIKDRIEKVRQMRLLSKNKSTKELARTPHLFGQIRHVDIPSIVVPSTTSERREYIPLGFLEEKTIISNLAYSIPCHEPFLFGVLSSHMHMVWVRAVAGGLETRIRYTSGLCYNTYPIPPLTTKQKEDIARHVYEVLEEREKHPEKTMAQLYDPDKMPGGLLEAHHSLDLAIERLYRSKPFTSDEERLEYLFALYERMIAEEKSKG